MKNRSIMIDLETLSTRKDARIMTIAAVQFDANTGDIGNTMHIGLQKYGSGYGSTLDSTIQFWMDEAQDTALERITQLIKQQPYTPRRALEKLSRFIQQHKPENVWSNGASFDLAILDNAYVAYDIDRPWDYWRERDTRTIVDAARQITGIDPKKQVAFAGQLHDALCDAIYQARYVSAAFRLLADKK